MADAEIDLLRSSLDLLILKALSWAPMHGYAISEWIDDATRSVLLVEEGTLYPPSIASSAAAGLLPSGASPTTTARRSSTR